MYAHERSLVKRLKDKPFVLLGVNSDEDRQALRKVMDKERITWQSWWDGGGASGPIATQWRITGWPSVYLLDAKGTIRFRSIGGPSPKELDKAIDELLAEAAKGNK